jgi:pimeloyl-ACP methyl ester carboxylesterase
MAQVKKAYYDGLSGGQIHYRFALAPNAKPKKEPIILLHMSAASSRTYEPLIARLAEIGHDCYAPDMPGYVRHFITCSCRVHEVPLGFY